MRVDQLWRYPVKSVGGEQLADARVGVLGIDGDRVLAVRDEQDEVTWAGAVPELMRVRAMTAGAGGPELILPDGRRSAPTRRMPTTGSAPRSTRRSPWPGTNRTSRTPRCTC
jgi:uncharacterized protein YcbX